MQLINIKKTCMFWEKLIKNKLMHFPHNGQRENVLQMRKPLVWPLLLCYKPTRWPWANCWISARPRPSPRQYGGGGNNTCSSCMVVVGMAQGNISEVNTLNTWKCFIDDGDDMYLSSLYEEMHRLYLNLMPGHLSSERSIWTLLCKCKMEARAAQAYWCFSK